MGCSRLVSFQCVVRKNEWDLVSSPKQMQMLSCFSMAGWNVGNQNLTRYGQLIHICSDVGDLESNLPSLDRPEIV